MFAAKTPPGGSGAFCWACEAWGTSNIRLAALPKVQVNIRNLRGATGWRSEQTHRFAMIECAITYSEAGQPAGTSPLVLFLVRVRAGDIGSATVFAQHVIEGLDDKPLQRLTEFD